MRLDDSAYVKMFDIEGISDVHAKEVLEDFIDAIEEIVVYRFPDEQKTAYGLHKMAILMKDQVDAEKYEEAADTRNKIKGLEEKLGITDANREEITAKYETVFSSNPMLHRKNIVVADFYACKGKTTRGKQKACMFPTYRIHKTGLVEVNINYLKVLALHKRKLSGENGIIYDFIPGNEVFDIKELRNPVILGEMYKSIVYSTAIHIARGHWHRKANGMVEFQPDEYKAQMERGGNRRRYVNTLAFWYKILVLGERNKAPHKRLRDDIMPNNSWMFDHLHSEEKEKLPMHLLVFSVQQINNGTSPFQPKFYVQHTGLTYEDVVAVMDEFPDTVSD